MRLLLAITFAVFGQLQAAAAEVSPRLQQLFQAIELTETVAVMREEGLSYGESLRDDLFPGQGGEAWTQEVARIYDGAWMLEQVYIGMAKSLADAKVEDITAYFDHGLGQRIVALEIEARRELADKRVEENSQDLYRDMVLEQEPRIDLLERFVSANDLVEANVVGAMNSNFAFYKGLARGNAAGFDLSEGEMLEDIWGQEQDIRNETSDWIYGYLVLAYAPLEDAELEDYVAFSRTAAGRSINKALFEAFDVMFVEISHKLGLAAARYMSGNDI